MPRIANQPLRYREQIAQRKAREAPVSASAGVRAATSGASGIASRNDGAALNWKMVDDVSKAAYWAYPERFLYDKGGDLEPIIVDVEVDESSSEDDAESSIDVIGILESEGIVLDDDGDSDDNNGDDTTQLR